MIDHSFAILAYKDSQFLSDCILSLKNQTVRSKIYLCTSTPSDFIKSIAREFNIDVFITEAGQGIAHDWNFALQHAGTKYVTLAHQDDMYQSSYAENCFHAAEKYSDTLICFTGYDEIVDDHKRSGTLMLLIKKLMIYTFFPLAKNLKTKTFKKLFLSTGNPIPCPSVMYNLHLLKDFRFSKEFSVSLDWEAWYRLAGMNGRFVFLPKSLMAHRIHQTSATTEGLSKNIRQAEDKKMFQKMWPEPIAWLLTQLYSKSYSSNDVG
jgi:hypothetical protein